MADMAKGDLSDQSAVDRLVQAGPYYSARPGDISRKRTTQDRCGLCPSGQAREQDGVAVSRLHFRAGKSDGANGRVQMWGRMANRR